MTQSAMKIAQQGEPLSNNYIQTVPDLCDRVVWRGHYYHLREHADPQPVAQPAPARLTDEQVLRCLATMTHEVPARLPPGWRKFARAVESACASAWGVKLGGGV